MRVLLINSVCGIGSTGRICTDLAQKFEAAGHEVKIAYGRVGEVPEQAQKYAVRIGTDLDVRGHGLYTRLFDRHGFGSKQATKKFLKWAETYDPELLWLHNIHGYYLNVEMLFDWIKSRPQMQVKWTLHDCWAFTGHCSHFDFVGCQKWKNGCYRCEQKRSYPASLGCDNSKQNYIRKKAAFCGVKDLKIITPSQWLADLAKNSFLGDYPVEVVYNKIDRTVFKPTQGDFRKKHGLESARIILGVAGTWTERKGLGDFSKLAGMLQEGETIVLVGLSQKQTENLPEGILGIQRTNSPQELAEIYSSADVFFNPTYEDTYPTVNLEAQACGTPVVTYDTGGSKETLFDARSVAVPKGKLENALMEIRRISLR